MYAPERLRDIAIPANRQMSFENIRQLFCRNFVPLLGGAVGARATPGADHGSAVPGKVSGNGHREH